MTNLVNIAGIHTVNVLSAYQKGKFRVVSKCRAGWMTISEGKDWENEYFMAHPESIITAHKKDALQTVEFCPDGGDYYLTIFARKGNRIVMLDEQILGHLTVGTINQLYSNTNLYNQEQYKAVGAKTWADRAYVPYQVPVEA